MRFRSVIQYFTKSILSLRDMSSIKAGNSLSTQKSYKPKEDFRYTKAQVDKIVTNLSSIDVSKRIEGNFIPNTKIDYTDDLIIIDKTSKLEVSTVHHSKIEAAMNNNGSTSSTLKIPTSPTATVNIPREDSSNNSGQKQKPQQNLDMWLDGLLG